MPPNMPAECVPKTITETVTMTVTVVEKSCEELPVLFQLASLSATWGGMGMAVAGVAVTVMMLGVGVLAFVGYNQSRKIIKDTAQKETEKALSQAKAKGMFERIE